MFDPSLALLAPHPGHLRTPLGDAPSPAASPGAALLAARAAWARQTAALPSAAARPALTEVAPGDTLTSLVRSHWARAGLQVAADDPRLQAAAQALARAHGLDDPDLILPGQRLALGAAGTVAGGVPTAPGGLALSSAPALAGAAGTLAWRQSLEGEGGVRALGREGTRAVGAPTPGAALTGVTAADDGPASAHPLLARTLDRAVARGYLPAGEREAVEQRIGALARRHGFRPDDFARVTLLESDGLNPRATNGSCHGILQFCGGPGRGAASVGLGHDPARILRLSVLEQLDLVDRYFDDTGLAGLARRQGGTVGLDDLYLTVLTPAAREVRGADAPLPIAGTQAAVLYAGADRSGPITRQSLLEGLQRHALDRLERAERGPSARRWAQADTP